MFKVSRFNVEPELPRTSDTSEPRTLNVIRLPCLGRLKPSPATSATSTSPLRAIPHGYVVLYLHGVHLNRLQRQAGVRRTIRPSTACPSLFRTRSAVGGPTRSASNSTRRSPPSSTCWKTCCRSSTSDSAPSRRGLACLGTSMGGQGRCDWPTSFRNLFPVVAAISPAIDFHKRYNEGDETIPQMYPDPEAARQDTATLAHPSAQLAAAPVLLLRPGRLPLARKRRPPADEALVAGRAARLRPGNHRRRPRLRLLQPHGRAGDHLPLRASRRRAAAGGVNL